jgi:cyanophycinase-like exopeptidase
MAFYWSVRSLLQEAGAGDVSLLRLATTKVDLASAKRALEASDAIFLSGGEVEDGMRWLELHGLVRFLKEMRSQGKLFLGMSAGSIMMGSHWVHWDDPDDDATAELFDCLGFAPTTFDTHAEDEDWKELKVALKLQGPGTRGYGIPSGGMAIVDEQGQISTLEKPLLCYVNVEGRVSAERSEDR